jgi:hypothetical protein
MDNKNALNEHTPCFTSVIVAATAQIEKIV